LDDRGVVVDGSINRRFNVHGRRGGRCGRRGRRRRSVSIFRRHDETYIFGCESRRGEHAFASLDRECDTVRRIVDVLGQCVGGSDYLRGELADCPLSLDETLCDGFLAVGTM